MRVFALCAAQRMFREARAFNADISKWNVGKVESMHVRLRAVADPPPRSHAEGACAKVAWRGWRTGVCPLRAHRETQNMFRGAEAFSSNIGNWEVNQVKNMGVRQRGMSAARRRGSARTRRPRRPTRRRLEDKID